MSFEKQLEHIADKSALHEFVDNLPEGAKGVFILEIPDESDESKQWMRYREFGRITVAEALYCIKSYEHWLFNNVTSIDD